MSDSPSSRHDTLPPEVVDRIDAVCDRFEAAWKAVAGGEEPRIEDYLEPFPEGGRAALLRELVLLDVHYQARRGERPRPEGYGARFPALDREWLEREMAAPPAPEAAGPTGAGDRGAPASAPAEGRATAVAWPEIPGYRILGELGRGGMGIVYRARQTKLNRLVAVKMILAGAHAGEDERRRFLTEAEAVARLQHSNIVQIHEIGEADGHPYFSLEFCPGGSLAAKLDGTPLPPPEAARLVEVLARGVQAAHEAGVVHRDLKPANVLLSADGTPKISDFGLAKRLGEAAGQTASGAIVGTPSYMAPEQAAGKSKEVGAPADVYALGAALYECLTGRPPFKAATPLDTILQVVSEEPASVRQLQPGLPADLETICHRCLQKEPGKRLASAEELAEDLRRFLAGEPIRARPAGAVERAVKWAKRRPALAALLGVVLLALVGLTALSAVALGREQKARQEADKATKAREFLVSIFQKAETDVKGGNVTVRQLLEEADMRIPVEFADQPELRRELLFALSNVKRGIARRTPQAMLLEVRGAVQLQSAAGVLKAAVSQALVNLDDRLSLGADGEVQLVFLSDLHKERLKAGQEVTIDSRGCDPADAVRERDDSVLMTFVRLPKGTFYMGWGRWPGSARKTEIKEDFEIAVHDVTQGQWEAIMGLGNNPSWFSRKGGGRNFVLDISDEELKLSPVVSVSWDDTQAFLKKLNEKERGRGYLYRLPTEAEWEYACRGGATSLEECSYRFYLDRPTNDLSSEQANFDGNFPFGKARKGPSLQRPTRVGAYPANQLGLCDMHGNVCQWTDTAEDSDRVIRGSGWESLGPDCQAANRNRGVPTGRRNWLGFRLARAIR
jgi:formylglycine-generating enzyme required for sulfatase activity